MTALVVELAQTTSRVFHGLRLTAFTDSGSTGEAVYSTRQHANPNGRARLLSPLLLLKGPTPGICIVQNVWFLSRAAARRSVLQAYGTGTWTSADSRRCNRRV